MCKIKSNLLQNVQYLELHLTFHQQEKCCQIIGIGNILKNTKKFIYLGEQGSKNRKITFTPRMRLNKLYQKSDIMRWFWGTLKLNFLWVLKSMIQFVHFLNNEGFGRLYLLNPYKDGSFSSMSQWLLTYFPQKTKRYIKQTSVLSLQKV